MRYTPNSVPDPATRAELERIAYALAQPQVGVVLYEVQQTVPPRLLAGMVCYFAAGVVGADEGLYEYSAGAWVQLAGGGGPPPTTATTPPVDDNSTLIATTAYVIGQASTVAPAAPGAAAAGVSLRYARADHVHAAQVNVAGSSGSCTGNAASSTTAAACTGNAATATNAANAAACSGNAATATNAANAAACSGNAATATTAAACTGNAASATTAAACTGNAATATTAAACSGNAATATSSTTQAADDNSTKVATTGYVIGQASAVAPAAPGAAAVGVSLRYARADHVHAAQVNVAGSSGSCTGNAASATTAAACSGNAATATTSGACSGNAATATTAGACTGNAATATTAAACSGNAATATSSTTQAADDNSTKVATTGYVIGQASAVVPLLAAGAGAVGASLRYARADHVHPASLMPGPAFESPEQAIPAGNVQLAVAHGLGRVPKMFRAVMRVKTAQNGYAVGDEIDIASINDGVRGTYSTWVDATNCGYIGSGNINMLARPAGPITGFNTGGRIVFYAW